MTEDQIEIRRLIRRLKYLAKLKPPKRWQTSLTRAGEVVVLCVQLRRLLSPKPKQFPPGARLK